MTGAGKNFATEPGHRPVSDTMRGYAIAGLTVVILLVGVIGGWAATVELAGAVITQGTVVVESNVKKVQHPTGGIVGEIRVKDGDKVAAGDLLVRLDDTISRANLQIIAVQLDELGVRSARLIAERDGKADVALPLVISDRMHMSGIHEIVTAETALFHTRRSARDGQKSQLEERIAQLKREIEGSEAQESAKGREIELIASELVDLHSLLRKNLVPSLKVTSLERESARLTGERAQVMAAAAQGRGKIAEISLQIIQIERDLKSEVMKEMREIQAKRAELEERKVAAEDQLRRIEIRSPQAGIVHQLAVHTVGGVASPSEPLMLIVPEGDALVIELKVLPQDIDSVHVGQPAFIRFQAFNQRTTPEFKGEVSRVAADLTREPQTGLTYFVARVSLSEAELRRMGELKLRPGMPAEVQVQTEHRTALSYLIRPLSDQFARVFKEK